MFSVRCELMLKKKLIDLCIPYPSTQHKSEENDVCAWAVLTLFTNDGNSETKGDSNRAKAPEVSRPAHMLSFHLR